MVGLFAEFYTTGLIWRCHIKCSITLSALHHPLPNLYLHLYVQGLRYSPSKESLPRNRGYPQRIFLVGKNQSASKLKTLIFVDITPRSGLNRSGRVEGTYCLHHEGLRITGFLNFILDSIEYHKPLKYFCLFKSHFTLILPSTSISYRCYIF
jgi:hypothetical protein